MFDDGCYGDIGFLLGVYLGIILVDCLVVF